MVCASFLGVYQARICFVWVYYTIFYGILQVDWENFVKVTSDTKTSSTSFNILRSGGYQPPPYCAGCFAAAGSRRYGVG
jgi:hypothetical protein